MKRSPPAIQLRIALVVALLAPALAAEEAPNNERALRLGHAGLAAFESQDYETALENFELAERSAHSPVFVLYMAKAQLELGELLGARKLLRRVAKEELDEHAPAAWRRAQLQAAEGLEEIAVQIPSLLLSFRGGTPPFSVSVAKEQHVFDRGPALLELNPGSYECVVRDARGRTLKRELRIATAERKARVEFEFVEQRPLAKRPPPPPVEPDNRVALASLGVGLVAASVGVLAGTVATLKYQKLKENCVNNVCPKSEAENAARARQWANVSSVGLGVGLVGVGGGLLLWESAPTDSERIARGPFVTFSGRF